MRYPEWKDQVDITPNALATSKKIIDYYFQRKQEGIPPGSAGICPEKRMRKAQAATVRGSRFLLYQGHCSDFTSTTMSVFFDAFK